MARLEFEQVYDEAALKHFTLYATWTPRVYLAIFAFAFIIGVSK